MLKKLKDVLVTNIFDLSVGYIPINRVGQDRKVENSNQRGLHNKFQINQDCMRLFQKRNIWAPMSSPRLTHILSVGN